jgi:phospholipase/carboxylesterase
MIFLAISSRGTTWDLMYGPIGPDVAFLDRALAYTFARCNIDPHHACLGGFSDGATYSLAVGLMNGDLFTDVVSYSPGFLAVSDTPVGKPAVFISHGVSDPVLPIATTQHVIVPYLTEHGYSVTYREFMGGHEVPSEISEAALDWFLR